MESVKKVKIRPRFNLGALEGTGGIARFYPLLRPHYLMGILSDGMPSGEYLRPNCKGIG